MCKQAGSSEGGGIEPSLTDDALRKILARLPGKDVAVAACVSRAFRSVALEESLWKLKFLEAYGSKGYDHLNQFSNSWRRLFSACTIADQNWSTGCSSIKTLECPMDTSKYVAAVLRTSGNIAAVGWNARPPVSPSQPNSASVLSFVSVYDLLNGGSSYTVTPPAHCSYYVTGIDIKDGRMVVVFGPNPRWWVQEVPKVHCVTLWDLVKPASQESPGSCCFTTPLPNSAGQQTNACQTPSLLGHKQIMLCNVAEVKLSEHNSRHTIVISHFPGRHSDVELTIIDGANGVDEVIVDSANFPFGSCFDAATGMLAIVETVQNTELWQYTGHLSICELAESGMMVLTRLDACCHETHDDRAGAPGPGAPAPCMGGGPSRAPDGDGDADGTLHQVQSFLEGPLLTVYFAVLHSRERYTYWTNAWDLQLKQYGAVRTTEVNPKLLSSTRVARLPDRAGSATLPWTVSFRTPQGRPGEPGPGPGPGPEPAGPAHVAYAIVPSSVYTDNEFRIAPHTHGYDCDLRMRPWSSITRGQSGINVEVWESGTGAVVVAPLAHDSAIAIALHSPWAGHVPPMVVLIEQGPKLALWSLEKNAIISVCTPLGVPVCEAVHKSQDVLFDCKVDDSLGMTLLECLGAASWRWLVIADGMGNVYAMDFLCESRDQEGSSSGDAGIGEP